MGLPRIGRTYRRRAAGRTIAVAAVCLALPIAGASASPVLLTARLVKAGQLAGMKPNTKAVIIRSASGWSRGDTAETKALKRLGFVAGVSVALVTPNNSNRYGLSYVIQLSSAANARAELKSEYSSDGPWTHFAVPGIPGAVGFERLNATQGARNVTFALGPYAYLVAAAWLDGAHNSVSRSAVISAAKLVYQRVR